MRFYLFALAAAAVGGSASAMPVSTFLAKAEALKSKGPLALLSSDYKVLKNEVRGSAAALREERLAAAKAGRKAAYCPTGNGLGLSVDEIMGAMRAVPAQQRGRTEVKDALRAHLAQRFPCPG